MLSGKNSKIWKHLATRLSLGTRNALARFAIIAISVITVACNVDDQRLINSNEIRAIVDPKPLNFDYKNINDQHKVLVGIIDSGVDYTHPLLANHIHYRLDANNRAIGVGRDYVANDDFASPYIARTAQLTSKSTVLQQRDAKNFISAAEMILDSAPDLIDILNPARAWEQELSAGAHHGTHVAGLASYDEPRIGLLPYRVLPTNEAWAQNDSGEIIYATTLEAIKQAVSDGARVINLSLGITTPKNSDQAENLKTWILAFGNFMRAHPEVLFVAAAGNEGSWTDGRARLSLPCGIPNTKNLLCVGSLDSDEKLSDFSNIPLMDVPLVFIRGQDLLSTVPQNMCLKFTFEEILPLAQSKTPESSIFLAEELATKIHSKCDRSGFALGLLSGTSMATPLVSRLAALELMQNPNLSGEAIIQILLSSGTSERVGPLNIQKLSFKKPSWYANGAENFQLIMR